MSSQAERPLRVGVVDYLNSRPLAWDFLNGIVPPGLSVSYHFPAELARELERGRLDVGLVPTIELQRTRDLLPIAGPCVASRTRVRSVLVVSRVEPSRIRRVALDENSRTSAALVKIILADRYDVQPEYVSQPPRLAEMLAGADAALVIGDPALAIRVETGSVVLDLAEEWWRLTGLPFVFALWAARRSRIGAEVVRVLRQNLEHGKGALPEIARRAACDLGLEPADLLCYLTENLTYDLGRDERRGLAEFHRKAAEHELIPTSAQLEFWGE